MSGKVLFGFAVAWLAFNIIWYVWIGRKITLMSDGTRPKLSIKWPIAIYGLIIVLMLSLGHGWTALVWITVLLFELIQIYIAKHRRNKILSAFRN